MKKGEGRGGAREAIGILLFSFLLFIFSIEIWNVMQLGDTHWAKESDEKYRMNGISDGERQRCATRGNRMSLSSISNCETVNVMPDAYPLHSSRRRKQNGMIYFERKMLGGTMQLMNLYPTGMPGTISFLFGGKSKTMCSVTAHGSRRSFDSSSLPLKREALFMR